MFWFASYLYHAFLIHFLLSPISHLQFWLPFIFEIMVVWGRRIINLSIKLLMLSNLLITLSSGTNLYFLLIWTTILGYNVLTFLEFLSSFTSYLPFLHHINNISNLSIFLPHSQETSLPETYSLNFSLCS